MQRAVQRSLKEGSFNGKRIHHECSVILRQLSAVQLHAPRHRVCTIAHAPRTRTQDNGITESIDLELHIRDRILKIFDLQCAVRHAHHPVQTRCGERSVQLQCALRMPECPLHILGKDRQKGEIGIVEHNRQIKLFIRRQLLITRGGKCTQGQCPVRTCHVADTVDVLRHDKLLQINDRIAQPRLPEQLIERIAAHTAILRHEVHIRLRVLRVAADMRRQRRRTRHRLFHPGKLCKEPKRDIRRCDIYICHTVEIYRPDHREATRPLRARKLPYGQHTICERDIELHIVHRIRGKRTIRNRSHQCNGGIVQRAAELHLARNRPREPLLPLIRECQQRRHIHLFNIQCAAQRPRLHIVTQTRRHRAVRPLAEARILQIDDPVFIVRETANLPQLHTVHRDRIRLQLSAEDRTGDRAPHLAVKDAVPGNLVGQLVLKALHIEITHLGIEVEKSLRTDRAIQNHIHHR